MKNALKILPLLTFAGLVLFASTSSAQVAAAITVSVTVIPAPEVDFSPVSLKDASVIATGNVLSAEPGITLRGSSNVLVRLDRTKGDEHAEINFQQPGVRTITAKELRDVKRVEIIYLGS